MHHRRLTPTLMSTQVTGVAFNEREGEERNNADGVRTAYHAATRRLTSVVR
jgi:hypothetical protein